MLDNWVLQTVLKSTTVFEGCNESIDCAFCKIETKTCTVFFLHCLAAHGKVVRTAGPICW